jgi:ABC-2 type transport system permease protein
MLQRIWTVIQKEFIQTFRDKRTLLIQLSTPMIQLFLLAFAVNMNVDHIATIVADQSHDSASQAYVNALVASGYFDVVAYAPSQAEVTQAIDEGRVLAGIVIPHDFSTHVERGDAQVLFLVDGSDLMTQGCWQRGRAFCLSTPSSASSTTPTWRPSGSSSPPCAR